MDHNPLDPTTWTNEFVRQEGLLPEYQHLLEFFEAFDYHRPRVSPHQLDIRRPDNVVGHWQRCVNLFWALKSCRATGRVGLELGSAGISTPWCLSTDVRTGLPTHYPAPDGSRGITAGHLRVQAGCSGESEVYSDAVCGDTSLALGLGSFYPRSFGLVLSNHVLEHLAGDLEHILTSMGNLVQPGGYMVHVVPDNRWFDVMKCDPDHRHAWTGDEFSRLAHCIPGLDVIEESFRDQINYHSFVTVWRKP